MEHELRREISLQPAGSSQQNKKVGPRKIGTRLLYPQSVTVTSFCDTRTCSFRRCQMALRSYDAVICAVCCRSGNSDYYAVTAHKKEIYVFLCAFNAYNACNTDYRYNRLYLSHNGFR